MDKIQLVAIKELIDKNFFIPSYQRGYRWTKHEVESLLDDIYEFDKEKDGNFYCLQPLVVKENHVDAFKKIKEEASNLDEIKKILAGSWRVIDGQQRLTTIYLTLKYLRNERIYSIDYERDTDINKCEEAVNGEESIELYFLKDNYNNIREWFKAHRGCEQELMQKLLENTKFIWYDIDILPNTDEYEVFNNLNSGKIQLTNAELVKALFLKNTEGNDSEKEIKQNLMAEEFDQIERRLREPEFWYFLNGRKDMPSSCINSLFELMFNTDPYFQDENDKKKREEEKERIESVGPNKIFYYFDRKVSYESFNKEAKRRSPKQQFEQVKKVWEDVQKYFHILEGWFADAETFNLIGFLRSIGYDLANIYNEYITSSNKSDFKESLKNLCYKKCELRELLSNDDFPGRDVLAELRYDRDYFRVRNVLLLFNIASLNLQKTQKNSDNISESKNKKVEITKFSFASFHTCRWDVEHISPNNAIWYDELNDTLFAKEHDLNAYPIGCVEHLRNGVNCLDLLRQARKGGPKLKVFENELDADIFSELDKYVCVKYDSIMSLSNLTLLNEHDNRSLGCESFREKRKKILEFQAEGYFVPPCTLMVFTKGYNDNIQKDRVDFWDDNNREMYLNTIRNILLEYMPEKFKMEVNQDE